MNSLLEILNQDPCIQITLEEINHLSFNFIMNLIRKFSTGSTHLTSEFYNCYVVFLGLNSIQIMR